MPARLAIHPAEALIEQARLFGALTEMYGVDFVPGHHLDARACDGAVLFDVSRADAMACARRGLRCLAFVRSEFSVPRISSPADVTLSTADCLTSELRGATMPDASADRISDLGVVPGDQILATAGDSPLWIKSGLGAGVDLVAVPAPRPGSAEYLFSCFQEDRWIALLPLLQFLQEISGWTTPAPRACFMLDDPNLHWPSYGYVRYAALADDAARHGYHVAFATVPFDAWYVHEPTARVFEEHPDRLSLLIDGNNHTRFELHRATQPVMVAAQALQRIERFERKTGLRVARFMAAPHGACSESMADALLQTGFDGACISRGSLMGRNPTASWRSSAGMHPAEWFGRGLPVFPRFGMPSASHNLIRLSLFLGQPLIIVGHHDDLRDGVNTLGRIAGRINAIASDVRWCDVGEISASNYRARIEGRTLRLRLYSRRVRVQIPESVTHVAIEAPWLNQERPATISVEQPGARTALYRAGETELFPVSSTAPAMVAAQPPGFIDPHTVPAPQTGVRAALRRQLCEGRDRLRPAFDRVAAHCRLRVVQAPLRRTSPRLAD